MPASELFILLCPLQQGVEQIPHHRLSKMTKKKVEKLHECKCQVLKILEDEEATLMLCFGDVIIPVIISTIRSSLTSILTVSKRWQQKM